MNWNRSGRLALFLVAGMLLTVGCRTTSTDRIRYLEAENAKLSADNEGLRGNVASERETTSGPSLRISAEPTASDDAASGQDTDYPVSSVSTDGSASAESSAQLEQEREIAMREAQQQAEVAKESADQSRASEQAEIEALTDTEYSMIFVQRLSQLQEAADKLEKKGYYGNYNGEYNACEIFDKRQQLYRRLKNGYETS